MIRFLRKHRAPGEEDERRPAPATLQDKLIKLGAQVVRHARYVTFQLSEVAVSRELFRAILDRIRGLALFSPLLVPG